MTYQETLGEQGRQIDGMIDGMSGQITGLIGELAATQADLARWQGMVERLTGELAAQVSTSESLIGQLRACRAKLRACRGTGDHAYSLLVGMAPGPVNNGLNMDIADAKAGRVLDCRRSFDTTLPPSFAQSDAGADITKRASVWSFKQNSSLLAITALLRTVPDDHKLFLVYWHEPEDDFTTTVAIADYVDRFKKCRVAVDAVNAERVAAGGVPIELWLCTMSYMTDRWDNFAEPLVGVVDGIAFDGYAWASDPVMRPASAIWGEDIARARELGFTRIGIAEFGNQWGTPLHDPPQVVDISGWITDTLWYFRSEKLVFASYFNPNETLSRDSEFAALGGQP